jgi:hypothetical protein
MPKSKNIKPAKAGSTKSKRPKVKPPRRLYVVAKTTNGRIIQRLLGTSGVGDPRKYKDYVVLTTGRMLDWLDSYNVVAKEGGPMEVEGALLVHKSELHKLVPKMLADELWNEAIGKRVARKGPQP